MDLVIPSAMVNLVRGVRDAAGSIPSEAATCLEAVARWRGAEVNTRGNRVSPPGWNFVAADLCDLCVDLSSVDDWDSDDWDSSRYDRVCVRLNALGGVARGLASVAVDATDFEKIGSAISVSIVNLEKVITAVTASRHEATRVGDARTAGWTAAAALLSVPVGKGGGPKKSDKSLSALASAATVRLLDDALEGLPAVSQNANPGSADEPSHRLLAGLRAVHRLVEVVVPMYPREPESGLGRKIGEFLLIFVRAIILTACFVCLQRSPWKNRLKVPGSEKTRRRGRLPPRASSTRACSDPAHGCTHGMQVTVHLRARSTASARARGSWPRR